MTEETVPRIRQRINISQTAKGLHQVEVTLEIVDENPQAPTSHEIIASHALDLLKTIEKKLKDDKRKLATEESSS